jgi:hypothetical protein
MKIACLSVLAATLPLVVATSAAAASGKRAGTTVCADAAGSVAYSLSVYAGGAPPPPQLVTETEAASVDGASLGTNQFSQAGGWVSQFEAGFDNTSRVDLGTTEDRSSNLRTSTYAVHVTLRPSANASNTSFDGLVICAATDWIIPPP